MVTFDLYPTTPLSSLRDELAFEFSDLPTEVFDHYLLKVARDMARRSPLLRRVLNVDIEPCVTRYAVEPPDGLEMQAVLDVTFVPDGNIEHGCHRLPRFLTPPKRSCPLNWAAWYDAEQKNLVIHVPLHGPGAYCRVTMSALPSMTACDLPSEYLNEYLPTLTMGVRAQILTIVNKPWTSLNTGVALQARYESMLASDSVRHQLHGQQSIVRMRHGRAL